MSKLAFVLSAVMAISVLFACSKSDSKGANPGVVAANSSALQGLWLEKKDAEELRATGKVLSMCPSIVEKGIVTNALIIQASGRVTLYTEEAAARDAVFIGTLDFAANKLNLSDDFSHSFNEMKSLPVILKDNVLSFDVAQFNDFVFVKTSDTELDAYYKAQRACLH